MDILLLNAPSFFLGGGGGLFHKISLITCQIKYLLLDRTVQGQPLKQKHLPKVVLQKGFSEKFHKFHRKETLMKPFHEYLQHLLF